MNLFSIDHMPTVKSAMTPFPYFVMVSDPITRAEHMMAEHDVRRCLGGRIAHRPGQFQRPFAEVLRLFGILAENRVRALPPSLDLPFEAPFERLRCVLEYGSWMNSILGILRRERLLETRLLRPYPGGDYALLGQLALKGKFLEVPDKLLRRRILP